MKADTRKTSMSYDALIVGGGPAGMAAAVAARERGLKQVALIEREAYLGGVLPQCVHDGFGLHLFKHSYTGPEYADLWQERIQNLGIQTYLQTTVLDIQQTTDAGYRVSAVGAPLGGQATLEAKSLVVATGCRERTRGQLMIPGTRPAGVITAGTAQYMINIKNQLPGNKVVILGSGDIGLIMARRLTLEGAEVKMVLGQEATGLLRNHIACIKDFDIPIRYGWGLVSLSGRGQLFGVHIAPLSEDGSFDRAQKQFIRCNTLLIACGLIPEREVLSGLSAWDESDCSKHAGLFICGNARVPMDLVDQVTQEGIKAGAACASYVSNLSGAPLLSPLSKELAAMASLNIKEAKRAVSDISNSLDDSTATLVTCLLCPTGCIVEVSRGGEVSGQACERGRNYALSEMRQPMRTFTGTVMAANGHLVPVRSAQAVPRELLGEIAQLCWQINVESNIQSGEVVYANVARSGTDLVACSNARR